MKKTMLLTTLAFTALTLAGCGGSGKTKIGILQFGSFAALEAAKRGFVETLEKSSIKDQIEIEVKDAAASSANNSSMAASLASTKDFLYGIATPSASALKNSVGSLGWATPIVFSAVTDPVGAKLLTNDKAPEGNCTGVSDLGPIAEELEILARFPDVDNIVSLYSASEVNSVYQVNIAEQWMSEHNITFSRKAITDAKEIEGALAAISSEVDAVFIPTDDTIANSINSVKIANDARPDKLLIASCDVGMISGSVIAMGVDYYQCGVQAANMAEKIISKKATVREIPVETCTSSEIKINKTWADSLGVVIPDAVLNIPGAVIV